MLQGILFLAYSISFAQMNLGFYPKDTTFVPAQVQAARSKIFKISIPYYITLKEKDFDPILNAPNMPAITKEQTQRCKDQKQQPCVVLFTEITGTAFLGKTPDTLWTNCHIVTSWMSYAGQAQVFTKSSQAREFFVHEPLPIALYDTEGRSVWSPNEEAHLVAFSPQVNFPNVESACNAQDDMVKIKLSRQLHSDGLVWAKKASPNTLYMGGFPTQTKSRELLGKVDSDGKSFYWTFGSSLNKETVDGTAFINQKPNLSVAVAGAFLDILLADGVEGMSGSPVLDETGAVVGIYKGFVPLSQEQKDIPFISLYFSTTGMRFLEILSGE